MISRARVKEMAGTTDGMVARDPDGEESPSLPAGRDRSAGAESEELPGDSVCWLRLVCPECGTIAETEPPASCAQCGTLIEVGL
jgi:hypothetical protein